MTHSRISSMPAKVIGLTAIVAGVVLSTRVQYEDVALDELPNEPVAVYPVDRHGLSQLVLPLEARDVQFQIPRTKSLTLDAIGVDSKLTMLNAKSRSVDSTRSAYELKLEDQQAWGSLQRQVDLVSKKKRFPVRRGVVEIANADLPLVPGIEDPHQWYGQFFEGNLVSSRATNNTDESIIPIELTEGSFDFSAPITTALLPPLQKSQSVLSEPVELADVAKTAAAKTSAPVVRTARAWETGRY